MRHAEMVALLFGPVVLFAVTDNQLAVSRADLLAVKKIDARVGEI